MTSRLRLVTPHQSTEPNFTPPPPPSEDERIDDLPIVRQLRLENYESRKETDRLRSELAETQSLLLEVQRQLTRTTAERDAYSAALRKQVR